MKAILFFHLLPVAYALQCPSISTEFRSRQTRIGALFDENNGKDNDDDWQGFNPFERKETNNPKLQILESNTISLRQMRMKELMGKLLTKSDDPDAMNDILLENEELIMEPLEDENAVMGEDSIYDVGMTREERFEKYESVMVEREEKALNKSVVSILGAMKEFVTSRR
mmetsp:Transcript_7693/g.11277  ORF Transcript_7693/g.11277 Transcript_7693/m.11277 type:complete len:169 (+) Transcript_7693:58-564(+)|eukprot:CAMPEP_0197240648 /NCGR_PEP_ID=MMETSP1429-20130617/6879_1 /TAXON_ID=49237 /ORGANISM="Chaetoceros  sp., Strain UNC1202" /LENGTH=168 /DNA_ID=CAMNT_0042700327 /DNA_START=46 /DNA_END=552 /DNA_ORIENTATION=+